MTKTSTTNKKKTTAKTTSVPASSSKQEKAVSSSSTSNTSSNQTQTILMSLMLIGVVLVLFFTSFTYYQVSQIDGKVTKLDSFFASNAQGYGDSEAQVPTENQGNQGNQGGAENIEVNLEGVRSIGDEDAPVVITKYSDFKCGFCQRFHLETYDQIVETYVETGVVRFVYKDFPVVGGEDAANAAWCAEEQGKFQEFKDGLFNLGGSLISDSSMRSLAEELDMNLEEYDQCYSTQEYNDKVIAETQEAQNNGLTGTPSFVINGEVLVGALPFSEFERVIESKLE